MTMPRRLLLGLLLPAAPALAQTSPTEVVESFHARLLEAMRNATALGVRGREQRLRPAMEAAFNLPAMTRIAVGPAWSGLQPTEQQALVRAFSDWSIANYAKQFNDYGGESFSTLGDSTLASGDRLVRTQLNRPNDTPVALSYLLRGAEGSQGTAWRIVDVYLAGTISELASRRAEFAALLREGGAERLLADLRTRTAALLR